MFFDINKQHTFWGNAYDTLEQIQVKSTRTAKSDFKIRLQKRGYPSAIINNCQLLTQNNIITVLKEN